MLKKTDQNQVNKNKFLPEIKGKNQISKKILEIIKLLLRKL